MGKDRVQILIVGANASQGMYGIPLLDASVGAETHITFYDRRQVEPKGQLATLLKGVLRRRVTFVDAFPEGQYFDVVIVAVSSEQHVSALQEALKKLRALPRLIVLEKPLGVSMNDLRWYQSVSRQLQHCVVVDEPYYFMQSVAELLRLSKVRPVAEVNVWSSKLRRVVNNHGGLKIFGIEFPHLHGVASLLAGQVLDIADCQVNNYYRHVQGRPDSDGNFAQFAVQGALYTVAQGLGSFTMGRLGEMNAHHNPPRTRKIRVTYVDGAFVELDLEPAFPPSSSTQAAAGVLSFYDSRGNPHDVIRVPDNPRRFFAEFIVERALQPSTPLLDGVGLQESLARNKALLRLRSAATEVAGIQLP